jgi:hypothetical protein
MTLNAEETRAMESLLNLFGAPSKAEAQKIADQLVLPWAALAQFILAARLGALDPYRYACHFDEGTPSHLIPTDDERNAFARSGVGKITDPKALKFLSKTSQTFVERKLLAVHFFYTPTQERWHLIHLRQQDIDDYKPHWEGGRHVHYTSDRFINQPANVVWEQVRAAGTVKMRTVHIKCPAPSRR